MVWPSITIADNVRVLRRATTTTLDGSILMLSSSDGVSETLAFENGTFTSTFTDPEEGTMVIPTNLTFWIKNSDNSFKITLSDGDTYEFDATTSSGTLVDYENGVIDTEGTWSFTFERHDWEDYDDFSSGSLDSSKWEVAWWKGGRSPSVVNGALELGGSGDPSDPGSDSMPYQLSLLNLPEDGSTHPFAIITDSSVYGLKADVMLPVGSPYSTGLNFLCYDTTSQEADGSFKQFGPEIEYWSGQKPALEYQYLDPSSGEVVEVSLEAEFGEYYKMSLIQDGSRSLVFVDGQKVADFDYLDFSPNAFGFFAFNDDGNAFESYVKNVRVLRRSQAVPQINVKPGKMAGGRDSVYLQTPNGPELLEDAGEINFDLELVDQPTVSSATLKVDGQAYDLTQNEGPAVFRTRYGYGTGEVYELYDVESSSDSDWSSYANGKEFEFSLTVGGNEYAYLHELPGEAALPTPPNLSVIDADSWKVDQDGYDYLEVPSADNYLVTWDAFDTSDSRDFIQVSLVELIGEDEDDIFEDIVLSASATDYEIDGSLLEKDKYYLFYIEFLNVTQSENPNGFTHAPASDSSEFILRSSASSVTALGFMLGNAEPVTVVSDPNGQAVVVQVGDEYQWSSNLNGVTLWSVDQSGGDIQPITMRFENGRNFGNEGFYDSVALPQPYDMPFVIDENGYIKVTEDSGYQYYHVVSVENGVIATLEGDEQGVVDDGVSVADQWFFTTRAAAEEYYYSKVNPKDWMWFDQYPWVYSNELQEWLYFYPSGSKLLYWSNQAQAWREFSQ